MFGLSNDKKIDKPKVIESIGGFFDVPSAIVKTWVTFGKNKVVITLPYVANTQHKALAEHLYKGGHDQFELDILTDVAAVPVNTTPIPNVKNVIAIASGKGGVGKSTTSVNLAFALQAEGAKVGLLDADIYGPSIPIMLGNAQDSPSSEDNRRVEPFASHGVVATSIGYFVPAENATVWRGPMASRALQQLINETAWPELDYLIVDMPPGTGDIQLTMAQQVPVSGAVVVTTPQDLALADAIKGIAMFNKVHTPVIGLIENMSYHQCSQCGHKEAIFSELGGGKLAEQYKLPLLGKLPLDIDIRRFADGGQPMQIAKPEHSLSETYRQLARQTAKYCYLSTLTNNGSVADDDVHLINL